MLDFRPFPPLINVLSSTYYSLADRCLYSCLTALVVGLIIGRPIIFWLKQGSIQQVFRTRQQVRDLAVLHGSKSGIPTMGGVVVMIASLLSLVVWASLNDLVVTVLIVYFLCSLLGGIDDFLKILRGNSRGLASWQKLLCQALITCVIICLAKKNPPINDIIMRIEWEWVLSHFSPQSIFIISIIFYFCVVAGTSNAVNLTDGIDGLAISNIIICLVFFAVIAFYSCDFGAVDRSLLTYISGASELAVMCSCFVGGAMAFLVFNHHPASVFMGDVGAIGLGGVLAIVAMLLRQPFVLPLVGGIFVIEALSVMLQVASKKLFGRRIFLMSPLHHHFELKGVSEKKIVKTACVIQTLFVLVAFYVIFHGKFRF